MKKIKSILTLVISFIFFVNYTYAVDYYDGSDGVWSTSNGLPAGNPNIWLTGGTNRIFITENINTGGGFTIGASGNSRIVVQPGATLTVNGSFNINNMIIIVREGGTLNVTGNFSTSNVSSSRLDIDGTFNINGSAQSIAATWDIGETGVINAKNFINNTGSMDFTLAGQLNVSRQIKFHSGDFNIANSGVIDQDGTQTFLVGNANIINDGLITTNSTNIPTWGSGNFDCDGIADGGAIVFYGTARCSMCDDGTTNGGGDDGCFQGGNIPIRLPIELAYFEVTVKDNHFVFDWKTIKEENNDFFTIEYSTDLVNFKTLIDDIDGAGISHTPITYQESIASFNAGEIVYFRLKQTDFDEKFSYSPLVAITIEAKEYKNIVLRPNPNKGVFSILGIDELVGLSVTTDKGTSVSFTSNTSHGVTNVTLDSKSQGVYIIRAVTNSNTLVKSFIVE